jgi:hypothetical protein
MSSIDAFEAADKDRFVVHVTRTKNARVRVMSVELQQSDMRNRYSFKQGRSMSEVFVEPLAEALAKALRGLAGDDRIVSMPDFNISLPGLVMGGLRILCTKAEDGMEIIMLRMREYIGTAKSALKFDPALANDIATVRERIAVEVLRDIVNPLLDILSIARDSPQSVIDNNSEAIRRQLKRMDARQDEIQFYTGLLKRYISGCRSDAEKSKANGLGSRQPARLNGS